MKTKSKIFAMVEIAIVLCSLFLVATLPGIAAAQNQTVQKMSASEVTTASEDDFVLGIYGNANEDDTIDMRDYTHTARIICWLEEETDLADANYDGRISVADMTQIGLIILGRESELTIVQYLRYPPPYAEYTEEPVTVPMPIESIAALGSFLAYTLCALGETDKIVAVDDAAKARGEIKDLMEDKPEVGSIFVWDMEKILELNPDIVLAYTCFDYSDYREMLDTVGIPLVGMDFCVTEKHSKEIRNLGWMLNKQERAEEMINFEHQHLDFIEERVKDLDEEQKPRVYAEFYSEYSTFGPGAVYHETIIIFCGGINIFDDIDGYKDIDPEEVIERNPEVILHMTRTDLISSGYDATDTGQMEEKRNDIMSRPGFDHIDAVENERVYIINDDASSVHPSIYNSYVAKWFLPALFEDMDPVAIHEEWLQEFLGVEFKGVYAHPLL